MSESAGGRALLVVQVAGEGDVPPAERPAIFVGANMVGYHNAGSETALDLLDRLLNGSDDEPVASLLKNRTFYVAPALNPDAHDGMFEAPRRRRRGHAGELDRDALELDGRANLRQHSG